MWDFIIGKLIHILFVLVFLMAICQTHGASAKQNLLEFKFKSANVSNNRFNYGLSSTPVPLFTYSKHTMVFDCDGKDGESPANDVLKCEFDVNQRVVSHLFFV